MLHRTIRIYMSNIGKRGMVAMRAKYPIEKQKEWARKGGKQKGINNKKRRQNGKI